MMWRWRDAALAGLARLRRQRDDIVNWRGQEIYDHIEANLHHEVVLFLGKLEPVIHVLRKQTVAVGPDQPGVGQASGQNQSSSLRSK
jgi:hypothetical protein